MNNSYRIRLFAVMCAVVGSAPAIGRTKEVVAPNILCVHLYNPAAVAPETVEHAMSRVTRIFGTAGIATIWEQPPADSLEAHVLDLNVSADSSVRSDNRSCLVVRIAPDVPPGAYQGALGFALPFARSGIDVEAIYRRVQLQAKSAGVGAELILAYASHTRSGTFYFNRHSTR